MLISGITLLHWIVRNRNLGKGVLFVSYFALVFFTPFVAAIFVFLGTMDCFVNLRDKLLSVITYSQRIYDGSHSLENWKAWRYWRYVKVKAVGRNFWYPW